MSVFEMSLVAIFVSYTIIKAINTYLYAKELELKKEENYIRIRK